MILNKEQWESAVANESLRCKKPKRKSFIQWQKNNIKVLQEKFNLFQTGYSFDEFCLTTYMHFKLYRQIYREKPENKERRKAWKKKPINKAKAKAYRDRPEVKAKAKAQRDKPENKVKVKAHRDRPDIKVKVKAYRDKPEIKAKYSESAKKRYNEVKNTDKNPTLMARKSFQKRGISFDDYTSISYRVSWINKRIIKQLKELEVLMKYKSMIVDKSEKVLKRKHEAIDRKINKLKKLINVTVDKKILFKRLRSELLHSKPL